VAKLDSCNETQWVTWAQQAQMQASQGKVMGRIAPLASANPAWFAVQISCVNQSFSWGDTGRWFPLMSVIKPFLLLFLLHHHGAEAVGQWVGMQPSDLPFNSLEQLQADRGHPRNPMINSGAIALADKLPGTTAAERCSVLCQWLNQQATAQLALDSAVLAAVHHSDRRANQALVAGLASAKAVQHPELALATYEQICCLSGRVSDLAQLGLLLALGRPQHRQIVNAVMLTCGLYEASGLYATRIGLPMKSGISGALMAVVPGQGAIACYSPALDAVGNSVAGLAFVERLSQEMQLSIFG
jgi:glutaminase